MLEAHYPLPRSSASASACQSSSGHIADADALGSSTGEDVFAKQGNLEGRRLDMPRRLSGHVRDQKPPGIALTLPFSQGSTPPYYQSEAITQQTCGRALRPRPARSTRTMSAVPPRQVQHTTPWAWRRRLLAEARTTRSSFNWRLGITPKGNRLRHEVQTRHEGHPLRENPHHGQSLESGAGDAEEPLPHRGGRRHQESRREVGPVQIGVRVVGMIPIAARRTTPLFSKRPPCSRSGRRFASSSRRRLSSGCPG